MHPLYYFRADELHTRSTARAEVSLDGFNGQVDGLRASHIIVVVLGCQLELCQIVLHTLDRSNTGLTSTPLPEAKGVGVGLTALSVKRVCYRSIDDKPK